MLNGRLVILVGFVLVISGCEAPSVPAPTAFETYTSTDKLKVFQCEYPKGWTVEGGGRENGFAKFSSGTAAIHVTSDVTGSLLGDISQIGADRENPEESPVAKVHAMMSDQQSDQVGGYQEVGQPVEFQCSLGPARRSEFTGTSVFGTKVRGYRATILTRDRRVAVRCLCADSDWPELKPAFERILTSIQPGG